jgi:transcriptional regulator with XRE-family HTH domain
MPKDAPEPVLIAFGAAVRRLRRKHGWSQEDFADRVGVHRTYMGGIERGERNVALVNIAKVAEALGISLAVLMAEVDKTLPAPS